MFHIDKNDIVLVAIAKYENDYIKEWLDYHFNLGFDKIVVYDDGDGDVPYLDQIEEIRPYIDLGRLYIERCSDLDAPQLKVYNKFYRDYDFTWACFLDLDEFLTFKDPNMTVKKFFSQEKFDDTDIIVFNWLLYGDNGNINYEKKPVLERFTEPQEAAFENPNPMLVKSAIKKTKYNFTFPNPHCVDCIPRTYVTKTAAGKILENFNGCIPETMIEYSDAYIRHFFTKSMEEFLTKKLRRTSPCRPGNQKRKVDSYWIANKKTPEKEQIFNKFIERIEKNDNFIFNKTDKDFYNV